MITLTRRQCFGAAAVIAAPWLPVRIATAQPGADIAARFEFLSQNGNSNCSGAFLESIATMPAGARLQGSCCDEMDFHRYGEQIEGLKAFADTAIIPPDPYDIDAQLAAKLIAAYELELTPDQQAAYDYAMANADEGGPCCCQCWRWHNYGGLAKVLIRDYGFDGPRVTQVWDLSDGCGGAGDHAGH